MGCVTLRVLFSFHCCKLLHSFASHYNRDTVDGSLRQQTLCNRMAHGWLHNTALQHKKQEVRAVMSLCVCGHRW